MGFWVGFVSYAAVTLYSQHSPGIEYVLPLAAMVATSSDLYVQWIFVFLFGSLISISVVLVNHVIEVLHFSKMWCVTEIEKGMMNQFRHLQDEDETAVEDEM